jgi:hypothetical protein
MATYKGIKGVKVVTKTSDPTASEAAGTVWYNTPADALKYATQGAGAWASGNTLNVARRSMGGAGKQTAALVIGGDPGLPGVYDLVESYDGSTWTETTEINTGRYNIGTGLGSQTAALAVAGTTGTDNLTVVEEWNGSTWTEKADLNNGRRTNLSVGTTTAAMTAGGIPPTLDKTETWNGTSWTEVANLLSARGGISGFGTSTAAIGAGGEPNTTLCESWNGSSWAEVAEWNSAAAALRGGTGTSTDGILAGGLVDPPKLAATEKWDGTSWTEVADLATARGKGNSGSTGGSGSLSILAGGYSTANTNVTEEWTDPVYAIKTVTVS